MSNTGFELGLTEWNTFRGSSTITSDAFAGNNALELSEARSGVGQNFRAIAGETYTLSGYGKTSDTAWNGFSLRFSDQDGNVIERYNTRITTPDWQEYTIEAIAPANASRGSFSVWKSGESGTTVVDELTVTGSTPVPPPTDNSLLTNFGFEENLVAWNTFSGTEQISTTDVLTGNQSLELIQGGSGANQSVAITVGETYKLRAYAKTNNTAWVGLGMRFRDADGTPLETHQTRITTSDWGVYEIEGTAPADATRAEVYIWNGGDNGFTYLDAVSLQQVTSEPINQAPTIVNNDGSDNAIFTFEENGTGVIVNIDATDADGETEGNGLIYTLEGPDAHQMSIDPNIGELSFNNAPDFEHPIDSSGDNQYEVTVVVNDSQGGQDSQSLTIAVTDVDETPPDTTAPTASLNASNITTEGAEPYTFTVTYTDDSGVDPSTLDNKDIQVVRGDGLTQQAVFVSALEGTVTYQITAPGNTWNSADNGTYTIQLLAHQVSDVNGNTMTATTLGSFDVAIESFTARPFPIIVNGSFEANIIGDGVWTTLEASVVPGWESLNGERFEIRNTEGHNGVQSSDGSNHIELDYNGGTPLDGLYQDLQTVAGERYELMFDVRARGADFHSDSEAVVVEWNGEPLNTEGFRAVAAGEWTTITAELVGTGALDRLTLRESDTPGASDGSGPLLDNIRIQGAERIANGSFEANAVEEGQMTILDAADVFGWQSLNGKGIELWDTGYDGVPSPDGSNHAALDHSIGALDAIYQDIHTSAGQLYELTFQMRSHGTHVVSDEAAVVVEWNGIKLRDEGFHAAGPGEWTTITTTVKGTGGSDRLTFREYRTSGALDGSVPLIDNISLRAVEDATASEPIAPTPNGLGFTRETLVSGLDHPIAFTYADDGRIFVIEKAGRVKIIEEGQVVSTFIDINEEVNSYWDRGLMGIALDPDFETNGWVYLSFSVDLEPETPDRPDFGAAAGGRLIKIQASAANPNVADLSTRVTILDGHQMTHATHAVGDVDFDNNGNLIFSWGDGGFGNNLRFEAQDPNSKQGKFFRIDPETGFGVPENPYYDPANPDSVQSKVWVTGVRNPWRWTVDRPTGDVYFGEVTDGGPEEINIIRANATEADQLNFGWPYFEGDNRTNHGTVPDSFVYEGAYVELPHAGGYDAITGGAVYRGTAYPAIYDGRYFFANFGQSVLYTADPDGNFQQFGNFGNYSSPVDIQLAPNGTIQYLSMFDGVLYQLNYDPESGQPLIPNAKATASVTAGTGPLTVDFSSIGSHSLNGDWLSYEWDFDSDGIVDSTEVNPSFTYSDLGMQTATLTVRDDAVGVDTVQVEVTITSSFPTDGNLAFGKRTFQSSTSAGAIASRAVDGNTDATFSNGSVAATAIEDKAFWEIDLGAVYDLSSVQLFIGNQPLSNYYLLVSESEFTGGNLSALLEEEEVWTFNDGGEVIDEETIAINQPGRYLRVQLAETDFISLAEVKIFGELI